MIMPLIFRQLIVSFFCAAMVVPSFATVSVQVARPIVKSSKKPAVCEKFESVLIGCSVH